MQHLLKLLVAIPLVLFILIFTHKVESTAHRVFLSEYVGHHVLGVTIKELSPELEYTDVIIGTAFQLSYRGKNYVVTNRHVCNLPKILEDGYINTNKGHRLNILKVAEHTDLCLVEGIEGISTGLRIANTYSKLEDTYLVGHPAGLEMHQRQCNYVSTSYNGHFYWLKDRVTSHMLDCGAYGGDSGSPLVDYFGNVVGVLFASMSYGPDNGIIVTLEDLEEFLDENT